MFVVIGTVHYHGKKHCVYECACVCVCIHSRIVFTIFPGAHKHTHACMGNERARKREKDRKRTLYRHTFAETRTKSRWNHSQAKSYAIAMGGKNHKWKALKRKEHQIYTNICALYSVHITMLYMWDNPARTQWSSWVCLYLPI